MILYVLHQLFVAESTLILNVLSFGDKPNGVTDSTQVFMDAWSAACASSDFSTIRVPKGRYLLPTAIVFKGDNYKSPGITLRIYGTLVASFDYRILDQADNWLSFKTVIGVSIIGGALDTKGTSLWACKLARSTDCPSEATTQSLSFTNSKNIRIHGLMLLNSQMFHIVINGCQDVNIQGVKITAAGNSPNTDGIHVQLSRNVAIFDTSIKTGDDCVNWPRHQRLVDRAHIVLGKDLEEEGVQNVTVKDAIFKGGQNCLRIKSWARPSHGFVQGVQFLDVVMLNVQIPIVIDQNCCPHNLNCPGQVSGVKVSDVLFRSIQGTSGTKIAINLDCSAANPCSGITLENVSMICKKQMAQSYCSNAIGKCGKYGRECFFLIMFLYKITRIYIHDTSV
ncbi:polygalacturonase-like [Pyrus ussuriensis x Pyrus communis]|uniref:Polygalacturonase-like n=1 Tax=Pyrus ussuriensis x Pyrus communis TaxID=2448454 RepID=A0A5N5HT98_9ROSA|nr:polygalacturonase-like [Pyrus ussuriensis x Pyrus communis]